MACPERRTRVHACSVVLFASLLTPWSLSYAELVLNKNGTTVRDTETNLIWARNAILGGSPMTWQEALDWAGQLDYAGSTNWRLPSGLSEDGTVCNSGGSGGSCADTELGRLYHVEGIKSSSPAPFQNVSSIAYYWTSSEDPADTDRAMVYNMGIPAGGGDGSQVNNPKTVSNAYAWAVRDLTVWERLVFGYRWIIIGLVVVGLAIAVYWTRGRRKPGTG